MKLFLVFLFFFSFAFSKSLLEFSNQLEKSYAELKSLEIQSKAHERIIRQNLAEVESWDGSQFSTFDYFHNSERALNTLFNIRLLLRKNLEHATVQNQSTISLYRKTLTSLRYIEDQISEKINVNALIKKPINMPFEHSVGFNQNQSGNTFSIQDLKSGDILLIRGSSVTSSSIARITKAPATHSHLGIVYEDPETKTFYLLESMSHSGVIKTELNEALSHPLARISVYRHPDRSLATKAASFANSQYTSANEKGSLLKFDFSLDMTHNCRFFCSKFVSWVYQNQSDNDVTLPKFPSSIVRTNNAFKARIGVQASTLTSFLPSDIDLDPRFDLINEYRNPEMTAQIRLDDLITDKIFEWIEKENLDFKPSWLISLFSKTMIAFANNKTMHSLLRRVGVTLNPETPEELMSTMAIMLHTVNKIKKEILPEFESNYNLLSRNLPHKEIYNLIEVYKTKHPELLKYFIKKSYDNSVSCRKYYL